MKRGALVVLSLLLLSLVFTGCATKDYVKQQIDPLVDRISRIEARVTAVESKLTALEGKIAEVDEAKREARDARSLAQQAMQKAQQCCDKADAAARKADAAAERAEAAAARAENAAMKAGKAFEFALLTSIYNSLKHKVKILIIKDSSYKNALNCFNKSSLVILLPKLLLSIILDKPCFL